MADISVGKLPDDLRELLQRAQEVLSERDPTCRPAAHNQGTVVTSGSAKVLLRMGAERLLGLEVEQPSRIPGHSDRLSFESGILSGRTPLQRVLRMFDYTYYPATGTDADNDWLASCLRAVARRIRDVDRLRPEIFRAPTVQELEALAVQEGVGQPVEDIRTGSLYVPLGLDALQLVAGADDYGQWHVSLALVLELIDRGDLVDPLLMDGRPVVPVRRGDSWGSDQLDILPSDYAWALVWFAHYTKERHLRAEGDLRVGLSSEFVGR